MNNRNELLSGFDRIRIISLPSRTDRRRSVAAQLAALGVEIDGQRVAFHDAVRPTDAGAFDTIGARGCFLSHLEVLRSARDAGVQRLLILEDDVGFSRRERSAMPAVAGELANRQWDLFYGGSPVAPSAFPVSIVAPDVDVMLAHFIAFSSAAIARLVPYLDAMLARPAGSADGGPMHVDGAYCWFRRAYPGMMALAATPHLAHQRSSRTDIHAIRGIGRLPWLAPALAVLRAGRNQWRHWR